MKKILLISDSSSIHTLRWIKALQDFYKIYLFDWRLIDESLYDNLMGYMHENVSKEVAGNSNAFSYGAVHDTLNSSDTDYGVIRGGSFVAYEDAKNDEGDDLSNDDMELGLSRDAFNNRSTPEKIRVHYLDPTQFGQSYLSPSFHIKPVKNDTGASIYLNGRQSKSLTSINDLRRTFVNI